MGKDRKALGCLLAGQPDRFRAERGVVFTATGIGTGDVAAYLANAAATKAAGAALPLFTKAIFCNICVLPCNLVRNETQIRRSKARNELCLRHDICYLRI